MVLLRVLMGLALFLYGMKQLESGVQTLGYATFKRWLIRSTSSSIGSVSFGIGVTAILQSSSMVSLLVLAFASAGVLPLTNAVGVLLGANLGTTLTGWMVATVGFKLQLQLLAIPLMAVGGAMQLSGKGGARLGALGMLLFGFGLLIFGLNEMKTAVEAISENWDLAVLRGYGLWVYFLAGAAMAALIQSSSATMMMTLAALYAGLFDLQAAAALVIGADLGTTSTTALGSIGGHAVKRQLALAHVVFNVVVDASAYFVLLPLLPGMMAHLDGVDPLYALVAFHSLFNIAGLALFLPLLRPYSNWIGKRFLQEESEENSLLGVPPDVPDAALVATGKVLQDMRVAAAALWLRQFDLAVDELGLPEELAAACEAVMHRDQTLDQQYHDIKHRESILLAFAMDMQAQSLSPEQVSLLAEQGTHARALVYACKTLRDIRHNLTVMQESAQPGVTGLYDFHRDYLSGTFRRLLPLLLARESAPEDQRNDVRAELAADCDEHLYTADARVHEIAASDAVTGSELSSMLNVNRELHHASRSLLEAI